MMTLQTVTVTLSRAVKIWSKQLFVEAILYQNFCAATQQFRNNSGMQCSADLIKKNKDKTESYLDIGRSVYHFCNIYTVQRDTQCSCTD